MQSITSLYNNLRRNISPASKNDLDWRIEEVKNKLDRIEARLNIVNDKTSEYTLASTKDGYMLTFTNDLVIGQSLRDNGSFQQDDINKAIHLLEINNYKLQRKIFLDIGSNIGTHAIYALKQGFQNAVCIEADPENFRLLKINQILNFVDECCINVCAAASDKSGEVEIQLSPVNYGDHRIYSSDVTNENCHREESWVKKVIKSERLDKIIHHNQISFSEISFAWIDTQGHEGHVLSGGEEFLSASIPFVAEFWPYGLKRSNGWNKFRSILSETQREIFDLRRSINENSLVRTTLEDLDILYEKWSMEESINVSPHTDLIIANKSPT